MALAFKRIVWQERNISYIFLFPDEFRVRFGAVRVVRKEADICLISSYMSVELKQAKQKPSVLALARSFH